MPRCDVSSVSVWVRGHRYVTIINFYVESGQKMIQFKIESKIHSMNYSFKLEKILSASENSEKQAKCVFFCSNALIIHFSFEYRILLVKNAVLMTPSLGICHCAICLLGITVVERREQKSLFAAGICTAPTLVPI